MKIFHLDHYTDVIQVNLKQNSTVRGYQSRVAEAAGVHNSYLSRVMNGHVHLTPDQAARLCGFWKFTSDETDFFLLLVDLARAGSKELKGILKRRLEALKKKYNDLTERFVDAKTIEAAGQGLYYSTWYHSAIHFLLKVPGFHTPEAISERLGLPLSLTLSTLQTLEVLGLVRLEGKKWVAVVFDLHTSNTSMWASIYHANYRQRAAYKIHERQEIDMHFTGLFPISEKDFLNVKAQLQDAMERVRSLALPSNEEELYCLSLDWFKM